MHSRIFDTKKIIRCCFENIWNCKTSLENFLFRKTSFLNQEDPSLIPDHGNILLRCYLIIQPSTEFFEVNKIIGGKNHTFWTNFTWAPFIEGFGLFKLHMLASVSNPWYSFLHKSYYHAYNSKYRGFGYICLNTFFTMKLQTFASQLWSACINDLCTLHSK